MNPFFFGSSDRQLLGAYDPPRGAARRAVVLCNPWAREYQLAHATIRQLARRLACEGFHVLRFDYFGTGDSAGYDIDASEAQCLRDIDAAVDEVKDLGQSAQVALIGMRYGATLAARAAEKRRDVTSLLLWDPLVDGRAYLGELGAPTPVPPDQAIEAGGVRFSCELRRGIEGLTLESFPVRLPKTLVLNTTPHPDTYRALCQGLAASGVQYDEAHVPDVQVWREEWGTGGVGLAVKAISNLVKWIA